MGCTSVSGTGAQESSDRLESLTSWDADWAGLRVVVTGIGLSGFSAADTLIELGARVVVCDSSDSEENRAKADTLRIVGAVDVLLGAEAAATLPQVDGEAPELVVTSPGWRPDQPLLAAAAAAGIPVWGDVELAWRVRVRRGRSTAEWLTITGTNGKTTTVTLAESMLRAGGLRAIAAGNVGTPLLDAMIYENTRVACVYNAEDEATERMVEDADVQEGCRAIGFTTNTPAISMLGVVAVCWWIVRISNSGRIQRRNWPR